MTKATSGLGSLLRKAAAMPRSPAQIAALDEVVNSAQIAGDLDLEFRARLELCTAATFGGAPERLLVTLAWLLARVDEFPGRFDEHSTLIAYKWAIPALSEFEGIPRGEIERALDDYEARVIAKGAGNRSAHKLRARFAVLTGNREAAMEWLPKWRRAERDTFSDCRACDINEAAETHAFVGDFEEALREWAPVFEGKARCAEVPHISLGEALIPFLATGNPDAAAWAHQRGYELIRDNAEFIPTVAQHIAYLGLVGDWERGIEILERHLAWVAESRSGFRRLQFLLGARLLLGAMASAPPTDVRVPGGLLSSAASRRVPRAELFEWIEGELNRLVHAFDSRNGNDYFARRRAWVTSVSENLAAGLAPVDGPSSDDGSSPNAEASA